MNRKGITGQLITIIIMILFLMFIVVGFFMWSLIAPVVLYTNNLVTNEILSIPNDDLNTTTYLNYTFGSANRLVQNAEWVTYGLLFILFIVFAMFAYSVRTYPVLIFVWILLGFMAIFVAMALAQTYESVGNSGGLVQEAYESWEGNNFILQYLPWVVGGMWLIGGIILFAMVTKDEQSELLI